MATAARSRTYRMFPPAGHPVFMTQRGHALDATVNGYVDALVQDADALQRAGWTRVMEVGTTASRPVPGPAADLPGHTVILSPGQPYYDTTLSAVVFWSAAKATWVNFAHAAA